MLLQRKQTSHIQAEDLQHPSRFCRKIKAASIKLGITSWEVRSYTYYGGECKEYSRDLRVGLYNWLVLSIPFLVTAIYPLWYSLFKQMLIHYFPDSVEYWKSTGEIGMVPVFNKFPVWWGWQTNTSLLWNPRSTMTSLVDEGQEGSPEEVNANWVLREE